MRGPSFIIIPFDFLSDASCYRFSGPDKVLKIPTGRYMHPKIILLKNHHTNFSTRIKSGDGFALTPNKCAAQSVLVLQRKMC